MLSGNIKADIWLLAAACLAVLSRTGSAGTFEELCMFPLQYGRGELKDNICTVTYPDRSSTEARAHEVCSGRSPFQVIDAIPGRSTTCVYGRQYYCDIDGDVLIEDRCFQLRGYGRFFDHTKACGPHHTIHTVESHKALLWVSQLLSVVVNEVWIGNSPDSAKRFGAVLPESGTRSVLKAAARDQLVVKARIGDCCADGIEVGGLIYANPNDTKAYLCSRPAGVFVEGIETMAGKVRELGYKVTIGRDRHGDPRAFTVIDASGVVHDAVNSSRFSRIRQLCEVFPNGYVASQLDFFDTHEYRRVLSEFPGSVLLTTVQQRSKSPNSHPQCAKDAFVETNDNDNEDAPSSHWAEMASGQCLTRHQSMVAITKAGYREVTKAGHYQIMCAFGSPPNLRVRNGSRLECDRAARFDSQTGQCLCRHPESDCKLKDTKVYGAHPTGMACLSCASYSQRRSIVFLVDSAGSVKQEGWRKQLTFVADMLQHVENVRAAVVVLSCPAYVDLPMDTYTPDDLRKWSTEKPFSESATNAKDAYRYAEMLLEAEDSPSKTLIVLSRGLTTNCIDGREDPIKHRHKEHIIADNMRKKGIQIIYIIIDDIDLANAIRIADGVHNLIKVPDFRSLGIPVTHRVMKMFCDSGTAH